MRAIDSDHIGGALTKGPGRRPEPPSSNVVHRMTRSHIVRARAVTFLGGVMLADAARGHAKLLLLKQHRAFAVPPGCVPVNGRISRLGPATSRNRRRRILSHCAGSAQRNGCDGHRSEQNTTHGDLLAIRRPRVVLIGQHPTRSVPEGCGQDGRNNLTDPLRRPNREIGSRTVLDQIWDASVSTCLGRHGRDRFGPWEAPPRRPALAKRAL